MTSYVLEKTFTTSDGTRLFYRHCDLSCPRRVIVLHGLTEHSGCYVPLMHRIFPKGDVSWVALDMHGHGHSEGEREEIETHDYILGIRELVKHLGWAEGSYIGICHSFGSLLALNLTLKQPNYFKALILSAPFFATPDCQGKIEAVMFWVCANLFPRSKLCDSIIYRRLTHDKELIKHYQNDTLITRRLSLDAIRKIGQMQLEVRELRKVEIPMLILTGEKDMIVSRRAIRCWLANCQGEKLEHRFFNGLYHEVFKESPNENVIAEIQNFISKYEL